MKSADEASRSIPKNSTPSKLSKETEEELDGVASPGRVVSVRNDATNGSANSKPAISTNLVEKYENHSKKGDRSGIYYKGSSGTPSKERLGLDNGSNGSLSPLRHTPTRERDSSSNGHSKRGNGNREK